MTASLSISYKQKTRTTNCWPSQAGTSTHTHTHTHTHTQTPLRDWDSGRVSWLIGKVTAKELTAPARTHEWTKWTVYYSRKGTATGTGDLSSGRSMTSHRFGWLYFVRLAMIKMMMSEL